MITIDASSRNTGQDSGIKLLSIRFFSKPDQYAVQSLSFELVEILKYSFLKQSKFR